MVEDELIITNCDESQLETFNRLRAIIVAKDTDLGICLIRFEGISLEDTEKKIQELKSLRIEAQLHVVNAFK